MANLLLQQFPARRLAGTLFFSALCCLRAQNLTNGDFEIPDVPVVYFSEPPGWHFNGSANFEIRDNGMQAGIAQTGSQYFCWDELLSTNPAGIYQDVSGFVVGQTYTLSYWVSARGAQGTQFFGQWSVTASIAGVSNIYSNNIPMLTHDSNPGTEYAPWINPRLSFVATAETLRLAFNVTGHQAYQPGSGSIPVLDNVSILPGQHLLRIDSILVSSNLLTLSGSEGPTNTMCELVCAPNPGAAEESWIPVQWGPVGIDGTFTLNVPFDKTAPKMFYRVRQWLWVPSGSSRETPTGSLAN
jgi:hypothetical protein